MKIYQLTEHSFFCPCSKEKKDRIDCIDNDNNDFIVNDYLTRIKYSCEKNPSYFLFQLDRNFHLIIYYDCIARPNYTDFFTQLIKESTLKSKGKKFANVKKSIPLKDWIKTVKSGEFDIKNYFEEIIYIYDGNFKVPDYCIIRRLDFFDVALRNDELTSNYNEAKEKLTQMNLDFLLDQLYDLYRHNIMWKDYVTDKEIITTTNLLIKQINKLANGNN